MVRQATPHYAIAFGFKKSTCVCWLIYRTKEMTNINTKILELANTPQDCGAIMLALALTQNERNELLYILEKKQKSFLQGEGDIRKKQRKLLHGEDTKEKDELWNF